MLTFLKMVAAAFVALLLLLLIAYVVIRWKLKGWVAKFADAIKEMAAASVPPFRVELERDDEIEWEHDDEIATRTADLEAAGFHPVGDFDASEAMVTLRAFADEPGRAYAVLYEHAIAGVFVDLVAVNTDESRGRTFCSRPDDGSTKPPWTEITYRADLTTADLVAAFRETLPPVAELRPVSADDFKPFFEAAYAKEMDWRIERGGPDEEEIRNVCAISGDEVTPEGIAAIQTQWADAIRNHYDEEFRERFFKIEPPPISLSEADEADERVVFVHDRLGVAGLAAAYDIEYFDPDEDDAGLDDDDPDEPQVIEERAIHDRHGRLKSRCVELLADRTPREAFATLVAEFDPAREYRLLATLDEPFPADAYWRPGYSDEDYD